MTKKKTKKEFCFGCGSQQPCFDGCISFKKYFGIQLSEEQVEHEKAMSRLSDYIEKHPNAISRLLKDINM